MFTGIVLEVGKILSNANNSLHIGCQKMLSDIVIGESIAINGVCLTVTRYDKQGFFCDFSKETEKRVAINNFKVSKLVNLEKAVKPSDRLGGHIMQGHVDAISQILAKQSLNGFYEYKIAIPKNLKHYLVEKGSIAIDGISLTINNLNEEYFSLMLIPHTLYETCLKEREVGDFVNLEVDILGKYVFSQLSLLLKKDLKEDKSLSLNKLLSAGFGGNFE